MLIYRSWVLVLVGRQAADLIPFASLEQRGRGLEDSTKWMVGRRLGSC